MAALEKKSQNVKRMHNILNIMVEAKRLDEARCDLALNQMGIFIEALQTQEHDRVCFLQFSPSDENCRLDILLHRHLANRPEYLALWDVIKQVLLLSHGQASVERGFSVNKQVERDNMSGRSVIAERVITETVRQFGSAKDVPLTKELLLSASTAYSKFRQHLEDQKKGRGIHEKRTKKKTTRGESV